VTASWTLKQVLGGAGALAVGAAALRALLAFGASSLPRLDAVSFDGLTWRTGDDSENGWTDSPATASKVTVVAH